MTSRRLATLTMVATIAFTGSATAAPFNPPLDLACRASALRVDLLSLEPEVANPQYSPCVTQTKSAITVPGIAQVLNARTQLNPAPNVGALAEASAANVGITQVPGVSVSATAVSAIARTICKPDGFTRDYIGSSQVAGLVVNGTPQNVGTTPVDIPVPGVAIVHINHQLKSTAPGPSAGVRQRAIWIETLGALHTLVGDVVVAEAKTGRARPQGC
jgi:hypothetical protein